MRKGEEDGRSLMLRKTWLFDFYRRKIKIEYCVVTIYINNEVFQELSESQIR